MPRRNSNQRNQNLDVDHRPRARVRTPSYRHRIGYDQAIVTLTDSATGKRRDYWLGEYGSRASRELYHRLIAAWEATDRRWPELSGVDVRGPHGGKGGEGGHPRGTRGGASGGPARWNAARGVVGQPVATDEADPDVTVAAVIKAYWSWAKKYYRPDETGTLKIALRLLRTYYGTTPAISFGPTKLRLLREEMIRGDAAAEPPRIRWSRNYINSQVRRIQRMFKWAVSHELIPASVHQGLVTVDPLKRGRSQARESEPVGPVPMELVDAAKAHVARPVAALIDLQLLTAARGGELLKLRAIDIDTTDPSGIWVYRPKEHKGSWRGRDRVLHFGPQAQEVLKPFMANRSLEAYLFSPAEGAADRRASRSAARVTPLSCGNRIGTARNPDKPQKFGDHYTRASYHRAIERACDRAFPPPEGLDPEARNRWIQQHRWHPHQLRHTAATSIRRQFGLEAAQLVLGHASAQVTDAVYAQRDNARIAEVMRKIG